jgi:hypothetical protein
LGPSTSMGTARAGHCDGEEAPRFQWGWVGGGEEATRDEWGWLGDPGQRWARLEGEAATTGLDTQATHIDRLLLLPELCGDAARLGPSTSMGSAPAGDCEGEEATRGEWNWVGDSDERRARLAGEPASGFWGEADPPAAPEPPLGRPLREDARASASCRSFSSRAFAFSCNMTKQCKCFTYKGSAPFRNSQRGQLWFVVFCCIARKKVWKILIYSNSTGNEQQYRRRSANRGRELSIVTIVTLETYLQR